MTTNVSTRARPRKFDVIGWQGRLGIRFFAYLMFVILLAPLVILIGASFAKQSYVEFPPTSFSLAGYRAFFSDPVFMRAFLLSGEIAATAAICATFIGFLAAYILVRKSFPGRGFVWGFLLSPLILPQIIFGVALLQFYTMLGLANSYIGLVIGHVVAVIPYVIRTVGASLLTVDPKIEEAAADLGASQIEILALIVVPVVRGGALAGALFAFIMSWVNVEISIFISATGTYTLPVVLYNYIEYSITTTLIAAASVGIYVAVLLVLVIDRFVGIHTATKL